MWQNRNMKLIAHIPELLRFLERLWDKWNKNQVEKIKKRYRIYCILAFICGFTVGFLVVKFGGF